MSINRRALLLSGAAAGGGLALWYGSRRLDDGDAATKFAASTPGQFALNAWLKISSDGRVTCAVHRAEMGQGVSTALPMLLAEELDADWALVTYEFAPVDRDYFNFGILERGRPFGAIEDRPLAAAGTAMMRGLFHAIGMSVTISSASMIDAWDSLRPAGAAARAMLISAAARRWQVPAERLTSDAGRVLDPVTGDSLGYGELAAAAAGERPPSRPKLKNPADWRLAGRSLPRLDLPAKVSGEARYALDTRLPGLRFAAIVHSPVTGGRLASFNATAALKMLGVEQVIAVGERAVAVIAGNSWQAQQAARQVVLRSEPGSGASATSSSALFAAYRESLDSSEASVFRDDGDVSSLLAGDGLVEAEYQLPYLAHVCMEPMNCTALSEPDRLTIWAPTQANSIARDVAAGIAGLAPDQVIVHTTLMGGGFGRRAETDFVEQAVMVALAMPGIPVQVSWTREQDVQHDMYRPAALARVRARLDDSKDLLAFDYQLATQSVVASYFERTPTPRGGEAADDGSMVSGASNLIYSVPNLRVRCVAQFPGVPVGYWRSTGNSYNGFIVEAFIDELAQSAGADPLEFRLRHLSQPAHRRALETAAQRAGWGTPLQAGRGRGIALTASHGSVCAQVIEVTVAGAALNIDKVTCVLDCQRIIHPDSVRSQLESAITDGLAAALYGEITLRDGVVEQGNFNNYRLLRLAEIPAMDITLLESGGRPGGVGEPAVPAVAPALVNAIHAATGQRIRRLPVRLS